MKQEIESNMNYKVLKYLYGFIFLLLIPLNITFANTINRIEMDIKLDNEGNAFITEIWDVELNIGTEEYKFFEGINDKKNN